MAAVIPIVTKLSTRIIRILGCNPGPMTLQGTNTYIIGTGKRRILVDTGEGNIPQYINHLRTVLNNEGATLSHIFLSHWHYDHVGGLKDILDLKEDTPSCQVWKHSRKEILEEDPIFDEVELNYFKDGQEFSVEGATIRVLYTPGHSSDHVIFLLLEENAILSGDCIIGEGTTIFEDLYDYMNSLEIILGLQPTVVYPGHGNTIYGPQEKIRYHIEHRYERERQILDILNGHPYQNFSEMDLVHLMYKDTPQKLWKAAAYNLNHHLLKLLKEKRVRQIESLWQHFDASKI